MLIIFITSLLIMVVLSQNVGDPLTIGIFTGVNLVSFVLFIRESIK